MPDNLLEFLLAAVEQQELEAPIDLLLPPALDLQEPAQIQGGGEPRRRAPPAGPAAAGAPAYVGALRGSHHAFHAAAAVAVIRCFISIYFL